MNLLADESVNRRTVERLRREGHDVLYIAEMEPGIPDDAVLAKANERDALLLTADKDFGELAFRQKLIYSGVVLLRLAGLSPETKAGIVADVLREREAELRQAFSVVSPGMVRIRRKN
jgi:predicted nuclease of predicted toxin-antitoxin system